jgi:ankyrin repeat protein
VEGFETPLQFACKFHSEWVKFFLDHGADPNLRANGRSLLQLARSLEAETQREKDMKDEIVNLLLQYGANDSDESDEIQLGDDSMVDETHWPQRPPDTPTFATIEIPDL